ncbi:MAG: hypothetical protein EA350_04345 [Gemmatimonadales bacterium]|nr:MAG: hypothetical protein EA350_04345 [Gemmatimonadales bacterium]
MTSLAAALLALAMVGIPADRSDPPVSGGEAFHLEFRGGIGTGEFHGSASGGDRSAGANWGIRMGFRPLEQLVLSLGYGQSSFGCEGGICAQAPVSYSGSGIEAEVAGDWRGVRLGAGVTRQILGAAWTDVEGARLTSVSAPSIGWFTALSVDIPVSSRFSVAPGVRYLRHGADFGSGVSRTTVQMMADVGVRYRLPAGR